MQYLGGKTRIAKQIAAEIDKIRRPGQLVWDAFCGGLSVSVALRANGPVLSTDACAPLITLYKAVQAGWVPPEAVSKETWTAAKNLPDSDPLKAFCGFWCSYSGIWFRAYVPPDQPHTVKSGPSKGQFMHCYRHRANGRRLVKEAKCAWVGLVDFLDEEPRPLDLVLYCDPPYHGTCGYSGAAAFDYGRFEDRIRGWSRYVPVFLSEYASELGREVWSGVPKPRGNRPINQQAKAGTVERLFLAGA
jgi:DNA adenine methylase